jgi:hypothetical protein
MSLPRSVLHSFSIIDAMGDAAMAQKSHLDQAAFRIICGRDVQQVKCTAAAENVLRMQACPRR